LDVGFDDDRARRDHRARQLSRRRPPADTADEDGDHGQPDEIELADRAARVLLGGAHGWPPAAASLTTLRLPTAAAAAGGGAGRRTILRRISSRGPKSCCAPLASSRIRSQTASTDGRCAISTTTAPPFLRSRMA